ncbi:MAG TPA: hypothetical protein VM715_01820, partial [Candidatus Acidoferrum sp.]|nr:hypothetical protein [Candidatus Acidoferrum sp.]
VSVLAHELEEANTDPNGNAWYDQNGAEDADKCAWTFGSNQKRDANGAYYNLSLPGTDKAYHNYLIQRELSATDNKCYIDFASNVQ